MRWVLPPKELCECVVVKETNELRAGSSPVWERREKKYETMIEGKYHRGKRDNDQMWYEARL